MNITDRKLPVSAGEVSNWESYFSIQMPLDHRKLLSESNGSVMYDSSIDKELQVLSTSEAVEYFIDYDLIKYCSDSVPICLDGCSNIVVYKITDGLPCGIYAMSCSNIGWEDSVFVCNSIFELVALRSSIDDLANHTS